MFHIQKLLYNTIQKIAMRTESKKHKNPRNQDPEEDFGGEEGLVKNY